MGGLEFNPWVGHLGSWDFLLGEATENLYNSRIERKPRDAPANEPKVAGLC